MLCLPLLFYVEKLHLECDCDIIEQGRSITYDYMNSGNENDTVGYSEEEIAVLKEIPQ